MRDLTVTADRSRAGRIGAFAQHARHSSQDTTAAARAAALARFDREVDPEGTLAPAERSRRAEFARKAYFARLAIRSAQARKGNARHLRPSVPVEEVGGGSSTDNPRSA